MIEAKKADVRRRYGGNLSDAAVNEIRIVERQMAACKKCTGLPCKRNTVNPSYGQNVIEVVDGRVMVRFIGACKFWKERAWKSMFKKCQIPARYVGLTFADYEKTAGNERAIKWAHYNLEHPEQGLYFYGRAGVGKTMLMSIMAQEHVKLGRSVIFGDVPNLLDNLRPKSNSGQDNSAVRASNYDSMMKALMEVDILVLDDLGAEKDSEWATETLYKIINGRYNAGKPLLATSNCNGGDLMKKFGEEKGERIVSRLTQITQPVPIEGVDRRRKRSPVKK